jgi:hypothetical protein
VVIQTPQGSMAPRSPLTWIPRYSRSTEAIPLRSSAEMPACRACNHTVSPLDNRRLPTIQSPGCDTELMPSAETAGSSKKEL